LAEKLTKLDDSVRGDHTKILASDQIYFWKEYTSGRDYRFGPGNDLINNLKKPHTSSAAELRHKARVMAECSRFFRAAINQEWLRNATVVPIPPSKMANDPGYDDRMLRVCRDISPIPPLDVRSLVYQTKSLPASHEAGPGERVTIEELLQVYAIDENLVLPQPKSLAIFDDVLTAGVHYRALHKVLSDRFPGVPIVGFFVARRVFPNDQEVED
jgi:hypothetical protein